MLFRVNKSGRISWSVSNPIFQDAGANEWAVHAKISAYAQGVLHYPLVIAFHNYSSHSHFQSQFSFSMVSLDGDRGRGWDHHQIVMRDATCNMQICKTDRGARCQVVMTPVPVDRKANRWKSEDLPSNDRVCAQFSLRGSFLVSFLICDRQIACRGEGFGWIFSYGLSLFCWSLLYRRHCNGVLVMCSTYYFQRVIQYLHYIALIKPFQILRLQMSRPHFRALVDSWRLQLKIIRCLNFWNLRPRPWTSLPSHILARCKFEFINFNGFLALTRRLSWLRNAAKRSTTWPNINKKIYLFHLKLKTTSLDYRIIARESRY